MPGGDTTSAYSLPPTAHPAGISLGESGLGTAPASNATRSTPGFGGSSC